MGRRNLGTFEVTEYESSKRYEFKSLSGPLNSHTIFTFEMNQGSTKVGMSIQMRVHAINPVLFNETTLEKKDEKTNQRKPKTAQRIARRKYCQTFNFVRRT
jgi:hypothetical protein